MDHSYLGSRVAGDDYGGPRRLHHCGTDGAQQHSGEATEAVTAHDDQLRPLGLLDEMCGGMVGDHDAVHGDVGIVLLPDC